MRSIQYARTKGREARQEIGASPVDLLTRLDARLRDVYRVNLVPMRGAQMNGSEVEIDAEALVLKYDASVANEKLLTLFAHELGHVVPHQRLRDPDARPDPLLASAHGDAGPSAIARHPPRTYEETQTAAFALDFVAPDTVWKTWCDNAGPTAPSLGAHFASWPERG